MVKTVSPAKQANVNKTENTNNTILSNTLKEETHTNKRRGRKPLNSAKVVEKSKIQKIISQEV